MARTLDAEATFEVNTALPLRRGLAPRLIGLVSEADGALAIARGAVLAPNAPNLLEVLNERAESTPGCLIVDTATAVALRFNVPGSGGTLTEVEHTFRRVYPAAGLITVLTGAMQPNATKNFTVTLPSSGLWTWEARARRGSVFGPTAYAVDGPSSVSGVGFALLAWIAPISNPQPF